MQLRALVLAVLIVFPLHPLAKNSDIDRKLGQKNERIKGLEKRKKDTLAFLKKAKREEWRTLEVLRVLNRDLEDAQENLEDVLRKIDILEKEISRTNKSYREYKKEIDRDTKSLGGQLNWMYRVRAARKNSHLPGYGNLNRFFRRERIVKKLSRIDIETIVRLKKNLPLLKVLEYKLKEKQLELINLEELAAEKRDELEAERTAQLSYLKEIRENKETRLSYLGEIQEELERLNNLVFNLEEQQKLEKKAPKATGFSKKEHKLEPPVEGVLFQKFKAGKSSPYYRGVLVSTPEKEAVTPPLGGKVVYVAALLAFNKYVIVDHGRSSLSVYGNMDKIFVKKGDLIQPGNIIGRVAYDIVKKQYLFYFETRYRRKVVDPLTWLKGNPWEKQTKTAKDNKKTAVNGRNNAK